MIRQMKAILKFLKRLVVPGAVAVGSIIGTETVHQLVLLKQKPLLSRQVIYTDLSSLSADVKKQIALVPTSYTIQNLSSTAAKDVTIFVNSDLGILASDMKFTDDSEEHQISYPDQHSYRINVPNIRPAGHVSFQILSPAINNIHFHELSDDANFVSQKDAQATQAEKQSQILAWVITAFGVIIYLPIVGGLIYLVLKIGRVWRKIETHEATDIDIRTPLIMFLVGLYIYDDLILGSLTIWGGFIPLPRINYLELIYIFIFYYIVTRYKLVDAWLKRASGQNEVQKPPVQTIPEKELKAEFNDGKRPAAN